MRTIIALFIGAVVLAGPAFSECCCEYNAGPGERRVSVISSDGYFMQNGKVMLFRNGGVTELTQEATLDDGSRILLDGTVVLRDGTRRNLNNNQWIFVDGRFSDAIVSDNRTAIRADFNRDGYFRENGKTMVFRNGTRSEVTADVTLDNGSKLLPDGTLVLKDGTRTELREGQRMAFDGSFRERERERPAEPAPQNASRDRFNENAQPNDVHRDRGATQSAKENPPSTANDKSTQPDNKGRDRGATQAPDKPAPQTNEQPAPGRSDPNKPAETVPETK